MWQRIKDGMRRFMIGRHGADQLSLALLIAGLLCSLLTSLTGFAVFYWLGLIAYIYGIFRMFSRNEIKRSEENMRWVKFWTELKTGVKQFFVRLKNTRKYRYFKCPECKARLRLPRKVGEVTVTCGKCRHQFKQKA